MVYHKKKGMKTRKVRNLKRKTRRHKRRVGGRGSALSSILGIPDTLREMHRANTPKRSSGTMKKSSGTRKRKRSSRN
jgi:hypothetical protein